MQQQEKTTSNTRTTATTTNFLNQPVLQYSRVTLEFRIYSPRRRRKKIQQNYNHGKIDYLNVLIVVVAWLLPF
jgi:hypothetical protein